MVLEGFTVEVRSPAGALRRIQSRGGSRLNTDEERVSGNRDWSRHSEISKNGGCAQ
ncbi:hypothetical protein I79_026017 [Cricetulus griseus]|uniref:Uncharacterized protein n=1 Tax=Cricetulus griseus TaxID=10029 RepID=G3IPT9_CRIGR|nr:hypothetical protein I79_026017 [Cricetulus griseus]